MKKNGELSSHFFKSKKVRTMKQDKKRELDEIISKGLSRGLSLMSLSVKGSIDFAKLKITDAFRSEEEKKERLNAFFSTQAEKIVAELSKLKGSVMKAGQMLSVYGEQFFPKEINQVLKSLQSESTPVAFEQMHAVLLRSLGAEKLSLLEINPEPIAAASMGQVYQAINRQTKEIYAIKVQYPGVDQAIDSDLKALKSIFYVTNLIPITESLDEIFKEIRMMLHYEADYEREFEIILSYKEKLYLDKRFIIPEPIKEFSSKRVLTMSYEDGHKVDSEVISQISQQRRNKIGAAVMDLMFKEIFDWRMVQTDTHLGNYKIRLRSEDHLPDQIVLYDFGAVRIFPKKYIEPFKNLVAASLDLKKDDMIESGIRMGFLRQEDSKDVFELFCKICSLAIEGFSSQYESPSLDGSDAGDHPYDWKKADLLKRISAFAKDAIFTFKLRTPPREAIFLDRKMVGIYVFCACLSVKFGPRKLIHTYVH